MSKDTLFDKVWDLHKVSSLPGGSDQIFIGLHLIHEVTSPQAFGALKDKNLKVKFPSRTVATVDHIVPTDNQSRPFKDNLAEQMIETLEKNCLEHKIRFFNIGSGNQGIVHVVAPELGLTQPGMTIACGDSHTSTHGAFGSIAFGIGTSQVRDVLATQTIAMNKLKVRQIWCENKLSNGVYAKDLVLHIINKLGVKAGVGFAYEFAGPAINSLSMEERMTICNMSIEGGARCGYINPDEKTFSYIKNKLCAPKNENWDEALLWWKSLKSDANSIYDDVTKIDASKVEPTVTWGITPGQSVGINQKIPLLEELSPDDQFVAEEAFERAGRELHSGYDLKTARRSMNLLTIEWANRGVNMWTIDEGFVNLGQGTATYNLPADTIDLLEQVIRTNEGSTTLQTDLNLSRISVDNYASIPNKLTQGRPIQCWVDRLRDHPTITVWPVPDQGTVGTPYYIVRYWSPGPLCVYFWKQACCGKQ